MSDRRKDTGEAQSHANPAASSSWRMRHLSDMADPDKLKDLHHEQEILDVVAALSLLPDGLRTKVVRCFEQPLKKRGRPRESTKRKIWGVCARLIKENPSTKISELARKFDPTGYMKDPRRATDRMRHGIKSLQNETKAPRNTKRAASTA